MKTNGLFFRMESMDNADAGQDATTSLEVNAEASEAVEEVESASGDVTEVDTGITNAETAQEELGEVQSTMEEAVEDGDGLSPREVDMVNARLERIASLLGTSASAQGLTLRRESFGSSQSRLTATKMRLEGLKEFGNSIWQALKNGFKWLLDAVVNLFAKLTKNSGIVKKRLEDLKGRINLINSSATLKNDTLKASAKAFSVKGVTNKDTVIDVIESAAKCSAILEKISDISKPENLSKMKSSKEALSGLLKETFSVVISDLPEGSGEGSVGYGNLLNNKTVIVTPEKNDANTSGVNVPKISIGAASKKPAEDYKAFNKSDLANIVDNGLILAKEVNEFEKLKGNVKKTIEVNISYCDKQSKLAADYNTSATDDKGEKEQEKKARKEDAAYLGGMSKAFRVLATSLPTVAFSTAVAVADLVEAGINNFKTEEKK